MNQMTAHPSMPVHDLPRAGCLVGRGTLVTTAASDIAQTAALWFALACLPGVADAALVSPRVSGMALTVDGGRSDR